MSEKLSASREMFDESRRQLGLFSERIIRSSTFDGLRLAWQNSSGAVDCVVGAVDESFYKGFINTAMNKLEQLGLDFSSKDERIVRLVMSAKNTGNFRGISVIGCNSSFMTDFYRILTGADNSNVGLSLIPTEGLVNSSIDGLEEKVTEYFKRKGELKRFQEENVKSPFWGFTVESFKQNGRDGVRVSMPTGLIFDSSLTSSILDSNFGSGESIPRSVEVQTISSDPLSPRLEKDTGSGLVFKFIESLRRERVSVNSIFC